MLTQFVSSHLYKRHEILITKSKDYAYHFAISRVTTRLVMQPFGNPVASAHKTLIEESDPYGERLESKFEAYREAKYYIDNEIPNNN